MKELILLKSGEIMLKGLNRRTFEKILINNARRSLEDVGEFKYSKGQSTFYIEPVGEQDLDLAVEKLSKVFGFSGINRARVVEKDFDVIAEATMEYLHDNLMDAKTFKVFSTRSDKAFPMNSPQICSQMGGHILRKFPHISVDVHNPELEVVIEIREHGAYIHAAQLPGAGGMPVGSGGKAALLVSGGIDSPVAGYMMAKRGLEIVGVHFESPPYTSARALHKVETLCEEVAEWSGPIKLFTVPFTKSQEEMKKNCPEPLITVLMRRMMMRVAEKIAQQEGCGALITGESVGQVASQTLGALKCTENVVEELPVLRPVIGMDKIEIMDLSRKIGTYETSILPFEDCCTVFTPRRPKTNPSLAEVERAEKALDIEALVNESVEGANWKILG